MYTNYISCIVQSLALGRGEGGNGRGRKHIGGAEMFLSNTAFRHFMVSYGVILLLPLNCLTLKLQKNFVNGTNQK